VSTNTPAGALTWTGGAGEGGDDGRWEEAGEEEPLVSGTAPEQGVKAGDAKQPCATGRWYLVL
jgi:hypothetical protein